MIKPFNLLCFVSFALATCAAMVTPSLADPQKDVPGREWTVGDDFVPVDHRLIGLGCGKERLTYTAAEEDHFPAPCYAIGTEVEFCTFEGEYPADLIDCVRYLGDGW